MKRRRNTVKTPSTSSRCGDTNCDTFFKLMLSPSSQSHILRLPEKFVRAHCNELSNRTATLTVPTGETWKIALVYEDNELWFQQGWQSFVDHYSIGYGYFMLFIYQGNLKFTVRIFDLTACEISYLCGACNSSPADCEPCHADQDHGVVHGEEDIDDGGGDDDSTSLESSDFPSCNCNDSEVEIVQLDSEDDDHMTDVEETQPLESDKHSNETDVASEGTPLSLPNWLEPHKGLLKAVVAAGISMPKNPFFICPMKSHHLVRGLIVRIPPLFAQMYLQNRVKSEFIKLEAHDGRQCEVRCIVKKNYSALSKGWIIFARLVGFEPGDVCLFELSPTRSIVLKVHVAKKSQIKDTKLVY